MSKYAGRTSYRFRQLRAEFLNKCKANDAHCWLCGRPIDYTLPHRHPDAFNVDHVIPLSVRPELADDMTNWKPSHAHCNTSRGNRDPHIDIGIPSEVW